MYVCKSIVIDNEDTGITLKVGFSCMGQAFFTVDILTCPSRKVNNKTTDD